jgi:outer membrane protein OmpA-like peptidoglycan-associated protein
MKFNRLFITIIAVGIFISFTLSSCATKSKSVTEEPKQVQQETKAVKEKPAEKEKAKRKSVEKEETVVAEEPDLSVEKKVEELAIAKEKPARADSDGDGVYDDVDKCPGTQKGVKVDRNGCPEKIKEITSYEFTVEFDLDSSMIRRSYYSRIQEAIDFMKEHPEAELVRVVIEGHADSTGTDAYNYNLSLRRANSVKQFLLRELNIDPDIVQLRAYGERKPIANNKTEEGRQRNRRALVTFSILSFIE